MNEDQVLHTKLESARRELLDLSIRNRLLNTSRGTTRSGRLDIVDELSEQVYRILVHEKKAMTFKAGCERGREDEIADLSQLTLRNPKMTNWTRTVWPHAIRTISYKRG